MSKIIWTPEFKSTSKFYSCENENVERLSCGDLEESVWLHLDDELTREELLEKIENEETVDVTAWDPDMPSRVECEFAEELIENLDCERNPDGDDSINDMAAVKAAEQAFIDVLLANYSPLACERTSTISVNVARFVANLSESERARLLT
jgi:hypothetical protein